MYLFPDCLTILTSLSLFYARDSRQSRMIWLRGTSLWVLKEKKIQSLLPWRVNVAGGGAVEEMREKGKVLCTEEETSAVVPRDIIRSKKANDWTWNTTSLRELTHNLLPSLPRGWRTPQTSLPKGLCRRIGQDRWNHLQQEYQTGFLRNVELSFPSSSNKTNWETREVEVLRHRKACLTND